MKKLLLLLFFSTISFQGVAQDPDPDLFQTWYLYSYSYELGDTFYVADVEPFLSVDMTIDEQLFFNGIACNEYGGEFIYNTTFEVLELTFFDVCLCGTCNNPPASHTNLENNYFEYFLGGGGPYYQYEIWTDFPSGTMGLTLENTPGFILQYQNVPVLGTSVFNTTEFVISPNPVSETLFITSEGTPIQSISIYSISGKRILSERAISNQLDVSGLKAGLYFAEIATSEGKSIQKFIKK